MIEPRWAGIPLAALPPPISPKRTRVMWIATGVFGAAAIALVSGGIVMVAVPQVRASVASIAPAMLMLMGMVAVHLAIVSWPPGRCRDVRLDPPRVTVHEPLRNRAGNALYALSLLNLGVVQVMLPWAGERLLGIAAPALFAAVVVATCLYAARIRPARLTLNEDGIEYAGSDGCITRLAWKHVVRVQAVERAVVEVYPRPGTAGRSADGTSWGPGDDPTAPIVVRTRYLPISVVWLVGAARLCTSARNGAAPGHHAAAGDA